MFRSQREEVSEVLSFREPKFITWFPVTDNAVPDTFTPNYTSRKRVTHPSMCTHGGSLFPQVITPFGQCRRVSCAPSQSLVPRSGSLFLIPDPRSSFRILVPRFRSSFLVPDPRSGSSFLVPDPRSSFRILVPRSGSSFLVSDPRSSFRILVPRSRSSFLVPDPHSSFRI